MSLVNSLYKSLFGKGSPQDGDVISLSEHGRTGGVSTGQGYKFVKTVDEKAIIDEPDANTTYIGTAKIGAVTSEAIWQIIKVTVSGNTETITYADGNDDFDNVWDDRATLTYS